MTDLVSFKPTLNVYSQITGVPLAGSVLENYTYTFNGPYTSGGFAQVTLPGPTTSVTVVLNNGVDIDTVFNVGVSRSTLPSCTASANGVTGFLSEFDEPNVDIVYYSSTDPPSQTPFGATGTFSVTFTFSSLISGNIGVGYSIA
jgi:hypothetical protein